MAVTGFQKDPNRGKSKRGNPKFYQAPPVPLTAADVAFLQKLKRESLTSNLPISDESSSVLDSNGLPFAQQVLQTLNAATVTIEKSLEKTQEQEAKAKEKESFKGKSIEFLKEKLVGVAKGLASAAFVAGLVAGYGQVAAFSQAHKDDQTLSSKAATTLVTHVKVSAGEKNEVKFEVVGSLEKADKVEKAGQEARELSFLEKELINIGGPEKDIVKLTKYLETHKNKVSVLKDALGESPTAKMDQAIYDTVKAEVARQNTNDLVEQKNSTLHSPTM